MGLDIALIIRPRANAERMEELRDAVEWLRSNGHEVTPRLTFEAGDALRFAEQAADGQAELVIAAGGDGTINEVVNGLAAAPWQPRLGIIPGGTANDFAAGLGLPSAVRPAIEVALAGRAVAVDVARVNRRYYINVSTGGFGIEADEGPPPVIKRLLGPLAYIVTGARKFVDLQSTPARFRLDGRIWYEGEFLLFAVGNGPQTGGGTPLTPHADCADGRLDVLVVPALSRMDFLALLPQLRSGEHTDRPEVLYRQAASIKIDAERELSVHADGEPLPNKSFRYELAPRPLTVMLPERPTDAPTT